LRYTVPATINQVVVALKDTSIAAGRRTVRFHGVGQHGDHQGRMVALLPELYLFVAVVFLVLTTIVSRLERRFVGDVRHG
jgi:ABC-type amino acid transport system permease subunit